MKLKEDLANALAQLQPTMKPYLVGRTASKYVDEMIAQLGMQFSLGRMENAELDFNAEEVYEACGQVFVDGTRQRVYTLMQSHPTTKLVEVVYVGNSITQRVSRIVFNPAFKGAIMEEIKNLNIEFQPQHLKEIDDKSNNSVDIDPQALESYLTHTSRALDAQKGESGKYQDALLRNFRIAKMIQGMVKTKDGVSYVDEYWEEIDSGRIYGHGLSLQRVQKHVRHAALGKCHKYDFKASSFALMTGLALAALPDMKIAALKDYIKYRSAIRKRIAKDIGVSESAMKAVFTSLGFGADLKDNPYSSIRGTLGQEKYTRLMDNSEFGMIAAQLKLVSDVIDHVYDSKGFELLGRVYNPVDPKTGNKRNKNQKLAWIYQCMESAALTDFIQMSEQEALLQAHDCLYFKKKVSLRQVQDIKYAMSLKYPLLTFEHEEIFPIHADEDHGQDERAQLEEVLVHKLRIEDQERIARDYRPATAIGGVKVALDYTNETKEQYETRRRAQFLVDVCTIEDTDEDEYFKESYFR